MKSIWKTTSLLDIAAGIIANRDPLNKFGYNGAVSASERDIWEYDNAPYYNWLEAPTQLYASSDSINDRSDGPGARSVLLKGLDPNWMEQDELFALDGHNSVPANNLFIRSPRAKVQTVGDIGWSGGIIYFYSGTATAGVPDDPSQVYAVITPPHNQTLLSLWTVPAERKLHLTDWWASTGSAKTMEMHLYIRARADEGGPFQLRDIFHINNRSPWRQDYKLPLPIEGKSDIVVRGHLVNGEGGPSGPVSAGFSGWYKS